MLAIESVMRRTKQYLACESPSELQRWTSHISRLAMRSYLDVSPDATSGGVRVPNAPDIVVDPVSLSDDEWNERYQSSTLSPEISVEQSVAKGLHISSVVGAFLNAATHISQTIVYEYALPSRLQSVQKLSLVDDNGGESSEEIFFHQGMLFRLSQQPVTDEDKDPTPLRRRTLAVGDIIQRKVAGHELRCIRWAQEAATAVYRSQEGLAPPPIPLCSPLSCITDVSGFRFFVMCIPPVDDRETLAYGRLSPRDPFLLDDIALNEQLKLICRMMNLKMHQIDTGNYGVSKVSAGSDFQAHSCSDNRGYLMTLARAAPPDLPLPDTNQILTNQLRPEFVQNYDKPLSPDAFRSEHEGMDDSVHNDEECVAASLHLRQTVIPGFVLSLDTLQLIPTDSRSLSSSMHERGINVRHLGLMFSITTLPHVKSMIIADAVARTAKHLLNQSARAMSRKTRSEMVHAEARGRSRDEDFQEHNNLLRNNLNDRVLDFLNLILGVSEESDVFWEKMVVPLMNSKFGMDLEEKLPRRRYVAVHMPLLLLCIQQHCGLDLVERIYDFTAEKPITKDDIKSIDSKVKWLPNEQIEAFSLAVRSSQFMENKEYGKALQALNLKLSMHKATFGWMPDQTPQAEILKDIAEAYSRVDEHRESIDAATNALKLVQGNSMLSAKLNLIMMRCYFKLGQHTPSGKCFNAARKSAEWSVGATHPFMVELLSSLADLFYENSDFESSTLYLDKALKAATKSLGSRHGLVARLQSKAGVLLANRGDVKNSTAMLQTALEHFEKFSGDDDMVLSAGTMNYCLAEVTATTGKFNEALIYSRNALEARLQMRSAGNPEVLESFVQVAKLHENLNDVKEAVTNYEKALASLKRQRGEVGAATMVQRLSRKVLSLEVRSQPLSMRTMLQTAILQHPALEIGSRAHSDTTEYVLKLLYVTPPSVYLRSLLEFISAVEGNSDKLPTLPPGETFEGAVPSPAAQLACLASLAKEGEAEAGLGEKKMVGRDMGIGNEFGEDDAERVTTYA